MSDPSLLCGPGRKQDEGSGVGVGVGGRSKDSADLSREVLSHTS